MPQVLNPVLFQTLQEQFGEVRVVHQGEPRVTRRVPDPSRPGRFIDQVEQRGEQYQLCCPFCGDTRFRLYVSYAFGQQDNSGNRNFNLWNCHNEKCQQSEVNRRIFRSKTAAPLGRQIVRSAPPSPPAPAPSAPQPIVLPDGLIPITSLPATNPGPAYLIERGFDPAYLEQVWGVRYCSYCTNCTPVATDRILIPIYRPAQMFAPGPQELVLGGWQARLVPGLVLLGGSEAKYINPLGMQKSELLYGLPLAVGAAGPVFVVEGATDAWRVGPGAVALLGKDLSQTQKLLLVYHFAGRPIVVMLDPDAPEAAEKIQQSLQLARPATSGDNRVVLARLPDGRDPADCTREELFALASTALGYPCPVPSLPQTSEGQQ